MMEHPLNLSMLFGMEFAEKYWHVLMAFIVLLLVLYVGSFALRNRSEVPGRGQNLIEVLVKGVVGMCDDVMGPQGRPYIPLIFGIGLYVSFSNLIGAIPGFMSPTANLNSTVAPALVVFFVYQYIGIKKHGAHYIKHFLGPVGWLSPLMLIIELVGHLARPLSLSMRLFGNIFGEDLVIIILFMLVPFLVPLPMFFLSLFTSVLQAYVFMMLSMIYISGALEEAH